MSTGTFRLTASFSLVDSTIIFSCQLVNLGRIYSWALLPFSKMPFVLAMCCHSREGPPHWNPCPSEYTLRDLITREWECGEFHRHRGWDSRVAGWAHSASLQLEFQVHCFINCSCHWASDLDSKLQYAQLKKWERCYFIDLLPVDVFFSLPFENFILSPGNM